MVPVILTGIAIVAIAMWYKSKKSAVDPVGGDDPPVYPDMTQAMDEAPGGNLPDAESLQDFVDQAAAENQLERAIVNSEEKPERSTQVPLGTMNPQIEDQLERVNETAQQDVQPRDKKPGEMLSLLTIATQQFDTSPLAPGSPEYVKTIPEDHWDPITLATQGVIGEPPAEPDNPSFPGAVPGA